MTKRLLSSICLLIALLTVGGLLAGQVLGIPLVVGFVETGSMAPTMEPGDGFVAVPPALTGGLEEGDVITFQAEVIEDGRLTTHRIVGETDEGYITRGDANAFSDQQAGEPPVPRDRVVAEAVQVGGTVVVIPNLGDAVSAVRGAFAAVGDPFGLSVNQVVAFVLVALLAAYLLDESGAAGEKRTDRSTRRADGFSGLLFVVGAVALVVMMATLSMTAASGAMAVPYDSVDPGAAGQGGIPAGTTANASIELRNGGVVPMTAVLDSPSQNAALATERVSLGPRGNQSVNLSITAPPSTGSYEVTVERRQYLAVLPAGVLAELSAVNHWLAVLAVDLLLALVVGLVGIRLVGLGRVRLRPTRSLPFEVGFVRWLRSLYRS
jgi:signal peptidase